MVGITHVNHFAVKRSLLTEGRNNFVNKTDKPAFVAISHKSFTPERRLEFIADYILHVVKIRTTVDWVFLPFGN